MTQDLTGDLLAIQQVLNRYPHAVDDRDWAAFDLVFTEDVVFDMDDVGLGVADGLAALSGTYTDDMVHTDQGWRIRHRVVTNRQERSRRPVPRYDAGEGSR